MVSCQYLQSSFLLRGWGERGKAETNRYYQRAKSIILWRIIITYDNHPLPSNNRLSCASVSRDSALPFSPRHKHPGERYKHDSLLFSDLTAPTRLFPNHLAFLFPKALSNKASSFQQVWHFYSWPYISRQLPFSLHGHLDKASCPVHALLGLELGSVVCRAAGCPSPQPSVSGLGSVELSRIITHSQILFWI